MTNNTTKRNDPPLLDAIQKDFQRGEFVNSLKRDFKEIKEFYISSEKKEKLQAMSPVKRAFWLTVWILKSLILKLAPARRLIFLIAFVLFFMGDNLIVKDDHISLTTNFSLSAVLFVLVILLELKDKLLARDELEAGRKVQQALMPQQSPVIDGWQVFLFTRPANEVGGDLVDHLALNEQQHIVSIADVSGKGLQAALLTAKLQATIRALAAGEGSFETLFGDINRIFYRDRVPSSFASLLSVRIDARSGILRYVNAGHLPPIVLHSKNCRELSKGQPALGIIMTTQYREESCSLETGDVFIAYSDGVTEARNEASRFFGTDRFIQELPQLQSLPAEHIGKHIIRAVDLFVGAAPTSDDLSLIVIKKL
jgi:serine phosphatase RsbU (regulator of sigma subunit)